MVFIGFLVDLNNKTAKRAVSPPGHELVPADLARAVHVQEVKGRRDGAEPGRGEFHGNLEGKIVISWVF